MAAAAGAWESAQEVLELVGHSGAVRALATLPGDELVTASADKTLRIWSTSSGQVLSPLPGLVPRLFQTRVVLERHSSAVNAVAVAMAAGARAEALVASGGEDAAVVLWSAATGQARCLRSPRASHLSR